MPVQELNPGHFSWNHGLSALTFLTLSLATWAAIRGRIKLHRHFMRGSYLGLIGAFLGAVPVPRRDIPQLLVHRPLVLAATGAALAIATVTVVAVCSGHPRGPRTALPLPDRAAPMTGSVGVPQ